MTDAARIAGGRGKRLPLVLGLIVAAGGGMASFLAIEEGLVPPLSAFAPDKPLYAPPPGWTAPAFVEMEPIVVSLGPDATAHHLRVGLTLEVVPGAEATVRAALPRVRDALNLYLRAVDERDIALPALTGRLREGMVLRARDAAPPGTVRDVLVKELLLD